MHLLANSGHAWALTPLSRSLADCWRAKAINFTRIGYKAHHQNQESSASTWTGVDAPPHSLSSHRNGRAEEFFAVSETRSRALCRRRRLPRRRAPDRSPLRWGLGADCWPHRAPPSSASRLKRAIQAEWRKCGGGRPVAPSLGREEILTVARY